MKSQSHSWQAMFFTLLITTYLLLSGLATFRVSAQEEGSASPDSASLIAAMTQQQKLTANDGAANDAYGWAVAISGNTAVIGAPLVDLNGNTSQGAAYVYVRANGAWTMQTKLFATDGSVNTQFGYSVAIDGDTIVIGARVNIPTLNAVAPGAAYVFTRAGATWTQQAKLISNDLGKNDRFGESVAINNNTIVVGAVLHDAAGTPDSSKGAAYVFVRSGVTWSQQAKLMADNPQDFDFFGNSVAIHGDTIVVGAPQDNGDVQIGSAYVFTRAGQTWSQPAKLMASDGARSNNFGFVVSVSGDTVVVGAYGVEVGDSPFAGAAYVFQRSNGSWTQEAKLVADAADIVINLGFGWAVSVKGDTLAVGAYGTRIDGKSSQGAAYLFKRNGNLWEPQSRLSANDGAANDIFGASVALDGSHSLIVGTPQKGVDGGADHQQPGAAYFFSTVANDGTPQIFDVSIKGKKLLVAGANFEAPTEIYVNGQKQKKTSNDAATPTNLVIAAKAGKLIAPGQSVMIEVKNAATGKMSAPFSFTRPLS